MPLAITEVLRRTEQGVTRPFVCQGEDDRLYVVKGKAGCGLEALRAEWVAGRYAQILGLPIPPFCLVTVPEELIQGSAVAGIGELGGGLAFGSLFQEGAQEVSWHASLEVDPELGAQILLFDWWIQNNDRMLTELGGNPNLICRGGALNVIDHHAAFDGAFDRGELWEMHVFSRLRPLWTPAFQERHGPRLLNAAEGFDAVWADLPGEWFDGADRASGNALAEARRVRGILMRPISAPVTFWGWER